jgi:hypothetical protein
MRFKSGFFRNDTVYFCQWLKSTKSMINSLKGQKFMQISDDERVVVTWMVKVAGWFISFVAGIVSATWVVASKHKEFHDRLRNIELVQKDCPGKVLYGINERLDDLPDRIEEKMEKKFHRVHERIDEILLREK